MARSAFISNGRLAVGFDEKGFINDFYYPYVGQYNMTSARFIHHKIGLWVDGTFSWLDGDDWEVQTGLDDHAMINRVHYHNDSIGISISFRDFVDASLDVLGRVAIVENRLDTEREVRIFFSQVFQISDDGRADTAIFTPSSTPYILTYHGNISFAVGMRKQDGKSFDQFAVGNYGIEGKEGTYLDAEDGELSGNLVEHGGVDSIIAGFFTVGPKSSYHVDYWICASDKKYSFASKSHRSIARNGLYHYLSATTEYWKEWIGRCSNSIDKMDVKYQSLARKSIFTIKAHCDSRGGPIASGDSSIYNYGRDYYSYVWPRDAFYALMPLLKLGYTDEVETYLTFLMDALHPRGYVHHKYQPDGSMGSSWHPLMQDGISELNIQEDETASSVLLAIQYIEKKGTEHPNSEKIFTKLIKPCCEFMASYIDEETGLPHASYDLWEQVFLTSTYTTATVYSALKFSVDMASNVAPDLNIQRWVEAVESIDKNINRLFDIENQRFARGLRSKTQSYAMDNTLDISSLFGIAVYGPAKSDDTTVFSTSRAVEDYLVNKGATGGVIRYPGDGYMLTSEYSSGNPWFVCTLWLGRYYFISGNIAGAKGSLDWTLSNTTVGGMLSEQIDPENRQVRGVAPLVWSHAEFISLAMLVFS